MSVSGATNACSKSTVSHVVGSNGCEKLVQPRLRPMCISIDHSDVDYVGPRQPASRERSEESSERIGTPFISYFISLSISDAFLVHDKP